MRSEWSFLASIGVFASLLSSAPAQGSVSLVGVTGTHTGLGMGVRAGNATAGLWITGSWSPLLFSTKGPDDDVAELTFRSAAQGNADLYLHPIKLESNGARLGGFLAYRYNSLLEHGFSSGLQIYAELSSPFTLIASGGFTYFPEAEDILRKKEGFHSDVDFNFPFGANLRFGVGLALLMDLF